jgi:lipoprotein-releasing system ATP-binding protein
MVFFLPALSMESSLEKTGPNGNKRFTGCNVQRTPECHSSDRFLHLTEWTISKQRRRELEKAIALSTMNASAPNSIASSGQQTLVADAGGKIVLEARGLGKIYGSGERELNVFQQVNLILHEGEMVAIVAPSGAGKSTLLHLLATLDTPTSGAIYFESKRIETNDEAALSNFRNCAVGFLWQRHQLLPDFTAEENVAMPLLLQGESISRGRDKARNWLAQVGLAERAGHLAGQLSGGEQQRVAIARALVTRPRVLLADEPTGDLDERNAWAVFELLERLHRAHGLTSLIATHNLALAERCDRILGLEHGVLQTRKGFAGTLPARSLAGDPLGETS